MRKVQKVTDDLVSRLPGSLLIGVLEGAAEQTTINEFFNINNDNVELDHKKPLAG